MKGATPINTSRAHDTAAMLTHVELTWHKQRVEHRIRFGRQVGQQVLDRHRRVVSFAPGSIFAFVRWAANDFGTIISRIDIVRAVAAGERYQTLPFVRPGGDSPVAHGWLGQGRARAAGDRRRRSAGRRSGRRRAGLLAAHPQPHLRQ